MAFALILLGAALGLVVSALAAITVGAGPITMLLIFWTTGTATIFAVALVCALSSSQRRSCTGDAGRFGGDERGSTAPDTIVSP